MKAKFFFQHRALEPALTTDKQAGAVQFNPASQIKTRRLKVTELQMSLESL